MELLFADGHRCTKATLKRLILMGSEVGFMDAPSIVFNYKDEQGKLIGGWGTVAEPTPLRQMPINEDEVRLSYHVPPSGADLELYQAYINRDIGNPEFRASVINGLRLDPGFATKYIQPNGDYSGGRGHEILQSINTDAALIDASYEGPVRGELAFKNSSSEDRIETMRWILQQVSVDITCVMAVSAKSGLIPVSERRTYCNLLASRMSQRRYTNQTNIVAPQFGLEIIKSVIPDQLLAELEITDLIDYRKKAAGPFRAWQIELNRLASMVDEVDAEQLQDSVPRLVASEVMPKVQEMRNELESVRDQMFGDAIKRLAKFEFPTLALSHVCGLSGADALKLFAAMALPTIPILVDYLKNRRAVNRKYGMSYLLGVST